MICCECNDRIKKDERWDEIAKDKFIHAECQDALLDIPKAREGQKTQDAKSANKEFWT